MYRFAKRILDVCSAIFIILLLLPVLIVTGICIKIESKGPILFVQERSGREGKLFKIYKFRSMRTETPNLATDKLGDPTRFITRVGKFIRKTSIDELPQLINLIKGDMSLVGPRPALYNQYELIEARMQKGIDQLHPGITGYAQIMGRDFISDEQKVLYDKYYLDNLTLFLDIKIILLTVYKVIRSENVRGFESQGKNIPK
jgi:O-antigen biosynthesis protein WbqP